MRCTYSSIKRNEHLLYETSSLDDDALLALNGALSSQEKYLGVNFRGKRRGEGREEKHKEEREMEKTQG